MMRKCYITLRYLGYVIPKDLLKALLSFIKRKKRVFLIHYETVSLHGNTCVYGFRTEEGYQMRRVFNKYVHLGITGMEEIKGIRL